MAIFNPEPKDVQARDLIGYSKSIDTPREDRSKEFLLKGAGDTFENVASVADKYQEHNVKQQVATDQQKEADYELSWRAQQVGAASADDLLRVSQGPPQKIANYQDKSELLKQASESNKFLPSIYFEARQLALAKEYRTKYPGYTDTIDATTAKITGRNPANALRESLTQAANDIREKKDKEKEKTDAILRQHFDTPGVAEVYIARQNGISKDAADAIRAISNSEIIKSNLNLIRTNQAIAEGKQAFERGEMGLAEAKRKQGILEVESGWNHILGLGQDNQLQGAVASGAGADKPGSPDNVQRIIDNLNNPSPQSDLDARNFTAAVAAKKLEFQRWALAQATAKPPGGGPSPWETLGPEKIWEGIDKRTRFYDESLKAATNKDYGPLTASLQRATALKNTKEWDLVSSKDFGPLFQNISALKALAGDNFVSAWVLDTAKNGDFATALGSYAADFHMQMMKGQPVETPAQAIDKMKSANATADDYMKPFDNVIRTMTSMDAKPEAKINVAQGWYTPANATVYGKFALDTRSMDGKLIPGQETLFQRLYSPQITEEVRKLGKMEPKVWNDYRASAETVFKEGLAANSIVHSLPQIALSPGNVFSWSTEGNRINIVRNNERSPISERNVFRPGQTSADAGVVDSVNKLILPLVPIAKEQGVDVRVLVAAALKGQEQSPIYDAILNAIQASVMKPKPVVAK